MALNFQRTLFLGAKEAGGLKLKPMFTYHSKNPRALKNYAKSILPVLYKGNNKAWMKVYLVTTWFIEYFMSTLRPTTQKIKDSFQNITAH